MVQSTVYTHDTTFSKSCYDYLHPINKDTEVYREENICVQAFSNRGPGLGLPNSNICSE